MSFWYEILDPWYEILESWYEILESWHEIIESWYEILESGSMVKVGSYRCRLMAPRPESISARQREAKNFEHELKYNICYSRGRGRGLGRGRSWGRAGVPVEQWVNCSAWGQRSR